MVRLTIVLLALSFLYTSCTSAAAAEAEKEAEREQLQAVIREEADKLYQAKVEQEEIQQEVAAAIETSKAKKAQIRQAAIDHEIAMETGLASRMENMRSSVANQRRYQNKLQEEYKRTSVFKLGRSKAAKNRQLADIQKRFDNSSIAINFLEREINRIPSYRPVEQQKSPNGLINWISWSATRYLSDNLTPLADPYDDGITSSAICYIGAFPESERIKRFGRYEDLQIIGKEVGDAENELRVKVANATEVFTINLVKRAEYWYID